MTIVWLFGFIGVFLLGYWLGCEENRTRRMEDEVTARYLDALAESRRRHPSERP